MLPFEASRRLIGANLFFAAGGAQLETADVAVGHALLEAWRAAVARARAHLGWDAADRLAGLGVAARLHSGGASLALAAPPDALFTATEVNEWALCASLRSLDPARWPCRRT